MLLHVKLYRKYYDQVTGPYLRLKKLELIDWLSGMLYQDIPADEICVYASAIFLDIHVTIDFHHGFWATLDLPELNHDLAVSLSDLHLAYHRLCKYSFLCCLQIDLSTKGRKLLEHKLEHNQFKLQKELKIELIRIEEYNVTAENLINIELSDLNNATTGSITPSIDAVEVEKPNLHKDIVIKLHRVEEWNPIAKEKLHEQLNSAN